MTGGCLTSFGRSPKTWLRPALPSDPLHETLRESGTVAPTRPVLRGSLPVQPEPGPEDTRLCHGLI